MNTRNSIKTHRVDTTAPRCAGSCRQGRGLCDCVPNVEDPRDVDLSDRFPLEAFFRASPRLATAIMVAVVLAMLALGQVLDGVPQ